MKLLRLLRLAPLALLFAGVASAQTTGTIIGVVTDAQSGKPVAGALVVATSSSLQGEQTVITDKSGAFRIQALPPGDYKLAAQFDGYKTAERSDLTVRLDKTIRANLAIVPEAVQMEEQVVKTGIAPAINVGTAEAGAVVSREFTSNVPMSRGFQNVAIVAPTATFDLLGVSFAGATSNENNYILDGLSVNNPSVGTLGSQLLNNFLEEIDVKTGSFMPEYGFASAGIVNVVTKSGSNEFHGSVFANYQPGSLSPVPKAVTRAGESISTVRDFQNSKSFLADFGFEVGGPIIKDKLWFFAGIAPNLNRSVDQRDIVSSETGNPVLRSDSFQNKVDEIQYVGKLTYLFNENNSASVTGIYAPTKVSGIADANGNLLAATGTNSAIYRESERMFGDIIGRYTSKLLDKRLLVEAVAGWHRQEANALPVTVDGVDQAANGIVTWGETHDLSDFLDVPARCDEINPATGEAYCRVTNFATGGRGAYDVKNVRNRFTGKLAGTYLFEAGGSHQAKAGLEIQRTDFIHDKTYGGNAFFQERVGEDLTGVNRAVVPADTTTYLFRNRGYGILAADRQSYLDTPVLSTKAVSTSQAYFLQDSYSPIDGLTINAGVRWEMQQMGLPGQEGTSSFNITDNIAPRFQVIYDWTKQGRSKLSANWGRFYENVPLQLADRAFGNEQGPSNVNVQCVPLGGDKVAVNTAHTNCSTLVNAFASATRGLTTYGRTGAGATPVAPNLKGQYADMFGAGVEYEVMTDLAVGFDYTGRRLGSIIEDMSTDGDTYYVANPGTGKPFDTGGGVFFDPKSAVAVDPVTGISYTSVFPKPVREYDGFTFSVRKNFSNRWQGMASYTYSSLRGNYPGLFKADTGQLDPNLTAMFDLAELLSNQSGPLPQDIPHQFKLYGSYTFDFGPQLSVTAGGAFRAESGVPVNFLGSHPLYGDSEATILPRGVGGRTPFTTKVDLKGALQYVVKPPYTVKLSVDVLNVFNDQSVLGVDQDWTFDSVAPIVDGQCNSRNAVSKGNKIQAALADCPALQYLKTTSGRPVTINENWGQGNLFRAPLAVRFGLEFSF
jgi:hypothetical protein